MDAQVECRQAGSAIEVVDPSLGIKILRLTSTIRGDQSASRLVTSGVATIASLAQSMAPVGSLVGQAARAGQGLQIAFTPDVQRAIASGSLGLMNGVRGQLPLAVDQFGRIREIARVLPAAGVAGVGLPLLPILLPAAAAAAASYYQHQALQATIEEIQAAVDRIEERLRSDDWGILAAADDLTQAIATGLGGWDVPDQLRMELAVARQSVERVFRSRRRFVDRLVVDLDNETLGRPDPWTDVVKKLVRDTNNWKETSLYLEAMVVRARLTAGTALVVAADGDARMAAVLTQNAATELTRSYRPLAKALAPLAGRRPDAGIIDRIPGRREADDERFRFVVDLVATMQRGVGAAIDSLDEEDVVFLPAHDVKELEAAVQSDFSPTARGPQTLVPRPQRG